MVSKILSFGVFGVDAFSVDVECDAARGLPAFEIVGLPDTAVKEAKERVRSAYKNCGFSFPSKRLTVNLAPADVKKEGVVFDLPILLGLLICSQNLELNIKNSAFIGELSLCGELRITRGVLSMVLKALDMGVEKIYVPYENSDEVKFVKGIDIYPVKNITELLAHLTGNNQITPITTEEFINDEAELYDYEMDFSEVRGQRLAIRALEIAASGGHNILMIGPPGSGKSMLAKRLPTILPPLTFEEAIECTKLYSIAGKLENGLCKKRPFRSPHHTVSNVALCGGGKNPIPGEISLAHSGVLFLDELPEFSPHALDSMRTPLEENKITVSRIAGSVTYPSNFMLVCAMNPCKCGYLGHFKRDCICTPSQISRYVSRISGPLLDRIDIHIEVPSVRYNEISKKAPSESSASIRERVFKAQKIQQQRYADESINKNSDLTPKLIKQYCVLSEGASNALKEEYERISLSARGYDRILKVARTIADLEGADIISEMHIYEAFQYRALEKDYYRPI